VHAETHPVSLLQELGKQNPELLTLINANQQEFLRIINEPVPPEQAQEVSQQIAQFQAAGMGGGGQGENRESLHMLTVAFSFHVLAPCHTVYRACQARHSPRSASESSVCKHA
jgi:hypothetical protein